MRKIPEKCPTCSSALAITELTCPACGTRVHGQFQPNLFTLLEPDDFDFVVLFLKSKGNVKEMERELGISYWTIRSRLGEIVERLGLAADDRSDEDLPAQRQAILEQLNRGEIGVEEAAERLEQLKRKR